MRNNLINTTIRPLNPRGYCPRTLRLCLHLRSPTLKPATISLIQTTEIHKFRGNFLQIIQKFWILPIRKNIDRFWTTKTYSRSEWISSNLIWRTKNLSMSSWGKESNSWRKGNRELCIMHDGILIRDILLCSRRLEYITNGSLVVLDLSVVLCNLKIPLEIKRSIKSAQKVAKALAQAAQEKVQDWRAKLLI